jgi:opacity protein-like surface antigen
LLSPRLILLVALALGASAAAAAEEQSWSKRAPPPVKFGLPPAEHKAQDWSGAYVGVHGGAVLDRGGRESVAPGASALPK